MVQVFEAGQTSMQRNKKNLESVKKSKEIIDSPKMSSINLFAMDMTKIDDEHLYLLRGHLLIEEKLRELINSKSKKPDAFNEARLTFKYRQSPLLAKGHRLVMARINDFK